MKWSRFRTTAFQGRKHAGVLPMAARLMDGNGDSRVAVHVPNPVHAAYFWRGDSGGGYLGAGFAHAAIGDAQRAGVRLGGSAVAVRQGGVCGADDYGRALVYGASGADVAKRAVPFEDDSGLAGGVERTHLSPDGLPECAAVGERAYAGGGEVHSRVFARVLVWDRGREPADRLLLTFG